MISDFAKEKVFWTKKMNIRLVKFIESKPNIWNPKHPKYTSVEYRDRTYAEFASKYGDEFTGQAVKDRWTNIRSTFAHYSRKLHASRAKGEEYRVNWHLWEPCQFLMKVNRKGLVDSTSTSENCTNKIKKEDSQNDDCKSDDEQQSAAEDSKDMCKIVADNLVKILEGVQNDVFTVDNNKYGRIGQAVTEKLALMCSYDAAVASNKIMEILLLYDKDNPNNPNNTLIKTEN